MEIRVIDEQMKDKWEYYVDKHPHTIAWQRYDWTEVLKRLYSFRFYPIAAFEGDQICGILPLYHMKLRNQDILISVPYAVAGGITADSDVIKEALLDKAISLSKEYNSCNIILKQYKFGIKGELSADENYYNRELDLTLKSSELLSQLAEKNRQKIEESQSHIFTVEYPSDNIEIFYDLLIRHHKRAGLPCASKKWVEGLIFSNMYSCAILRHNGTVTAATLIKKFKKTVSYPYTCHVGSDKSIMLTYALYWNLIQRFASEGFEIFHSGRIPKSDMTDEYRLGWGGTKYQYYYQYYPPQTKKTEHVIRRGKKRILFQTLWRHLPLGVEKIVAPYIVKQFP